jgi:hypothetical protein
MSHVSFWASAGDYMLGGPWPEPEQIDWIESPSSGG